MASGEWVGECRKRRMRIIREACLRYEGTEYLASH